MRAAAAARLALAAWACLAAWTPAADPAADLVVEGPREPVLLGERFELVVRGGLPDGARLELGELPASLRAEAARLEAGDDGVRLVQPLRATRAGPLRLEQLEVVAGDARQGLPPVEIEVVLPLPDGAVPRVADALPPVPVPAPVALWPLLLGLVLLAAALAVWIERRRRRAIVAPMHPVPPDQAAIAALEKLRLSLPGTVEAVPPFVDAVSSVLRRYVEDRFGLRAPESTTEEFLALVAERRDALAGRQPELQRFLGACDRVKFARERPAPAAATPLLDVAEGFVEATR